MVFDPANRKHRQYYYDFVRTTSWGTCPVRFVVPEDHGDLVTMIQRSLIIYYTDKEFDRPTVAKKPLKTVAQKGKKTVDKRSK